MSQIKRNEKEQKRIGVCPKCVQEKPLELHHIFPVRFFKRKNNKARLALCRDCHLAIERILPLRTRLSKEEYVVIHKLWLVDKPPKIHLR